MPEFEKLRYYFLMMRKVGWALLVGSFQGMLLSFAVMLALVFAGVDLGTSQWAIVLWPLVMLGKAVEAHEEVRERAGFYS